MSEHAQHYEYYVDAKQYRTEHVSLTGAEIKKDANVPPTYQLFLEEDGDTPDKPITDTEGVDMRGREKHFFAVPPATFGSR
jgi:hypothetical protein